MPTGANFRLRRRGTHDTAISWAHPPGRQFGRTRRENQGFLRSRRPAAGGFPKFRAALPIFRRVAKNRQVAVGASCGEAPLRARGGRRGGSRVRCVRHGIVHETFMSHDVPSEDIGGMARKRWSGFEIGTAGVGKRRISRISGAIVRFSNEFPEPALSRGRGFVLGDEESHGRHQRTNRSTERGQHRFLAAEAKAHQCRQALSCCLLRPQH